MKNTSPKCCGACRNNDLNHPQPCHLVDWANTPNTLKKMHSLEANVTKNNKS